MTRIRASSMLLGALLSATAGCAFFGKSEPLAPRYYSAERLDEPVAVQVPAPSAFAPSDTTLRLGSVEGGAHLRERIAYRRGERELGFYEERRWAERPEVYLRRGLSRALFEERGMARALSGVAPTLEVELTDFDELRGPPHRVRVRARVLLIDQRRGRYEHTVGAEQPVEGAGDDDDAFARVAAAFALALGRVVDEISDRVVAELRTQPAALPLAAPAPQ